MGMGSFVRRAPILLVAVAACAVGVDERAWRGRGLVAMDELPVAADVEAVARYTCSYFVGPEDPWGVVDEIYRYELHNRSDRAIHHRGLLNARKLAVRMDGAWVTEPFDEATPASFVGSLAPGESTWVDLVGPDREDLVDGVHRQRWGFVLFASEEHARAGSPTMGVAWAAPTSPLPLDELVSGDGWNPVTGEDEGPFNSVIGEGPERR